MNHGNTLWQCAYCGKNNVKLSLCGACRVIRYCNTDHQRNHWKIHKQLCAKLSTSKDSKCESTNIGRYTADTPNDDASNLEFDLDKTLLDSLYPQGFPNGSRDHEPDLSTPIDSVMVVKRPSSKEPYTHTPALYQLELNPDNQSLADELGSDWLSNVTSYVLRDLNQYGFCAVDSFFGEERAHEVLSEVGVLHSMGVLSDGQVVSKHVLDQARGMIRGDKITWVTGTESGCETISRLVSTVDSVIANVNKHQEAGKLANYNITFRTRAMVACYPGEGARYVKHVDNPNGDGRCITAIYYLNKYWKPQDGGVLRIYPEGLGNMVAQIEPIFDRMLFFWSDRRNPHEVLPSTSTRYAITVWYLDQNERDQYKAKCSKNPS